MLEEKLDHISTVLERIARCLETFTMPETPQIESPGVLTSEEVSVAEIQDKPKRKKSTKQEISVEPEVVKAPEKAITRDDLAGELRIFVTHSGTAKAAEILKCYGASRISDIKPEDFPHILDRLKTANSAAAGKDKK